jgi:hypothetical protein
MNEQIPFGSGIVDELIGFLEVIADAERVPIMPLEHFVSDVLRQDDFWL